MDRYTRIVLTLIAIALWVLALKPVFFAVDVNIAEIAGRTLNSRTLPVEVENTVDVEVENTVYVEVENTVGVEVENTNDIGLAVSYFAD